MASTTPSPPAGGDDPLREGAYRDRNVADAAAAAAASAAATGSRTVRRRLLAIAALVVLCLAAVDVAVRILLPPEALLDYTRSEEATYTVKVKLFESGPSPDVLFLGSSRVRDGLVPEIFAESLAEEWQRPVRVFNLGLVNAMSEELLAIVRSHLTDPPPRLVVLGVSGSEVIQVRDIQYASRFLWKLTDAVDWMQRVTPEGFDARHVESYLELELCRAWYVFANRGPLREWLLDKLGRGRFTLQPGAEATAASAAATAEALAAKLAEYRHSVLSPDGYSSPTERPAETLAQRLANRPESLFVPSRELERPREFLDGGEFRELRQIAAELAARGTRLVIVELPVSPYLQELNPVLHGQVFRDRMAQLAEELACEWVPMAAESTGLANTSYLDVNHLSPQGAQRYTRLLFAELSQRGVFRDLQP